MSYQRLGHRPIQTQSTYHLGSLQETAEIVEISKISEDNTFAIVTNFSPFHPVNYSWSDQPSDRGMMIIGNQHFSITESVIAASDVSANEIVYHHDIRAFMQQRPPEQLDFGIAHKVRSDEDLREKIGSQVRLIVDEQYRRNLSLAHSACHLMALALNKATAPYWKKEICRDSLGNPDFDKLALCDAKITELHSRDSYRLGKSIRKKGLDTASLWADIDEVATAIEKTINQWRQAKGKITLCAGNNQINAKKIWYCGIDNKMAAILCGGTHVNDISEIHKVKILVEKSVIEPEFILHTQVINK